MRAVLPVNGWEPVIYAGQLIRRDAPAADASPDVAHDGSRPLNTTRVAEACATRREDPLDASWSPGERVDALVYRPGVRSTDPARVTGAKPAAFCRWIFDLLDARPGDEFVDVFPGSGGVARAWSVFAGEGDASRRSSTTDASRLTVVQRDA